MNGNHQSIDLAWFRERMLDKVALDALFAFEELDPALIRRILQWEPDPRDLPYVGKHISSPDRP